MIPENLKPCKTEKICDDNDATIFPLMKHLVEAEKMSERKAGKLVSGLYEKGRVSESRARKIYYDRKGGTFVPLEKPLKKQTDTETKKQLNTISKSIEKNEIADSDIKIIVDKIADAVNKKNVSGRVAFKLVTAFKKSGPKFPPKERKISDIETMISLFHRFLFRLDKVMAAGSDNISNKDRETMNDEFKLMVPRLLRLLDWIGIDLQELVTNYVNHYKEVEHEKQNAERLLGNQ